MPKESYTVEVTSQTSISVLLKATQRWPLPDGQTESTFYLQSLKDDLREDPDEEQLEEPVPVASILGTPSIMRRDDRLVYITGTKRIFVNGTNFRSKETTFVFDPPLYRDVDYVMEVLSSEVALLTLKTGRKWRSDGEPGPLKIKRLNTGGGDLRIDAKFGGVTVAEVQADLGAHGVTVETTSDKRLYQSSKTLTILGNGFNDTGVKGANTLRWANSLRGKGVNYTVVNAEKNQLDLELAEGSKWRANPANLPGTLVLLAVNAGAGPIPVGATEQKKGRAVATIYADPSVKTSAETTSLARTLSHELWVEGQGFTRSQTSMTLRAKAGDEVFDLRQFVDYVLVAFNETHLRVWLQDGKSWSPKDDAVLECVALDTGAGPWEGVSLEKPLALAKIVADASHSSDAAVTRTVTTQQLYETPSNKKLTIDGDKFCTHSAQKVITPADVQLTFSPAIDQADTFTVHEVTDTQITLDLKKNKKWPAGTLKVMSLKCSPKDDAATFAGEEGVAIATVLPNPVIEEAPELVLYAHHSKKLVVRGSGFSVEGTELVFDPKQDVPPFKVVECLEDFIALELNDDDAAASWVAENLLPAKDAPRSQGIKLKVVQIDTGAGAFDFETPPIVALVVNEPEGDICDDSCEWANDGICDDGTMPFLVDDEGVNGRKFIHSDDDFGGFKDDDDDDDIYGYGDEYAYGNYFDRGYDEFGEGWMSDWNTESDAKKKNAAVCAMGTDCTDCQPRAGDGKLQEAPDSTCDNTCYYARDNFCDDGRDGMSAYCDPGTDCQDCGPVGADNYTRFDDEFWDDNGANFYFQDDYWDDYDRQYWADDDLYAYDDETIANASATNAKKKKAKPSLIDDDDANSPVAGFVKSQANPFEIDPNVANGSDDSLASLLLAGAFVAVLALAACGALRLRYVSPKHKKNQGCLPFLRKSKDDTAKDLANSWQEMTNRKNDKQANAPKVPITPDVSYSGKP